MEILEKLKLVKGMITQPVVFFVIEEAKVTILDFSERTLTVL